MHFIHECASGSDFQEIEVDSSQGDGYYLVVVPPWDTTEVEIVCECPSYIHRGRCRHQREALNLVCNWSELDGEVQSDDEKKNRVCPECGGRTQVVVIGEE